MPNIIINDYCNLKCPYCFASDTSSNMDLELFKTIIAGLSERMDLRIGIIGGEPTLHPDFEEMIKFCQNYDFEVVIFTNGINLYKYMHLLNTKTMCLINVNNPENMSSEQLTNFNETMNQIPNYRNMITLGCNLHKDCTDYSFFFDRLKDKDLIYRLSVVAPTSDYDKEHMKEYYETMKPIFVSFLRKAKELGFRFGMDCNRIPRCYFNELELNLINEVIVDYDNWLCAPVQDVTSNLEIKDCFGRGNFTQFKTVQDLIDELLSYPITQPKNNKSECADCGWNHTCQGGCLAFKS